MILEKLPDNKNYDIESFNLILKNSTHILIGGTNGSGKSVLLDGLIYTALTHDKNAVFVLIDPKKVSFTQYKYLPNVQSYVTENPEIISTLKTLCAVMDNRYKQMEKENVKMFNGSRVYIIVDEIADLMTTCKNHVLPLFQRIAQLGRACRFKLICATQCPSREILPAKLIVNFTGRVALRCLNAIESRQILNTKGAENLPRYGNGIFLDCSGIYHNIEIPMIDENEILKIVELIKKENNYYSPVAQQEKDKRKKRNKMGGLTFTDFIIGAVMGRKLVRRDNNNTLSDFDILNTLSIIDDD